MEGWVQHVSVMAADRDWIAVKFSDHAVERLIERVGSRVTEQDAQRLIRAAIRSGHSRRHYMLHKGVRVKFHVDSEPYYATGTFSGNTFIVKTVLDEEQAARSWWKQDKEVSEDDGDPRGSKATRLRRVLATVYTNGGRRQLPNAGGRSRRRSSLPGVSQVRARGVPLRRRA